MSELLAGSGPKELNSACFTFLKPPLNKMGAMLILKLRLVNAVGNPLLVVKSVEN